MYKRRAPEETSIRLNQSVEGETIEAKVRRILRTGEPITDGAPLMYTERKDGVLAETNIRTDRFEIAIDEADTKAKAYAASRTARMEKKAEDSGGDAPGGDKGPPGEV